MAASDLGSLRVGKGRMFLFLFFSFMFLEALHRPGNREKRLQSVRDIQGIVNERS